MECDLCIDARAVEEIGVVCKQLCDILYLSEGIHRSAGGIQYCAVGQLVTCPMRTPDPVHVCFTAERDREERVDAAPAVGLDGLTDVGGAVPAGL